MSEPSERIRPDCRHYRGLKPCGRAEDCRECLDFAPLGPRVLIIKLGALGDVLRTTPLLKGLKKESPEVEIVWLTSPASAELLQGNPLIDQVWLTGAESLARLMVEEFDRLICLDKEPQALACAVLARAGSSETKALVVSWATAISSVVGSGVVPAGIGALADLGSFGLGVAVTGAFVLSGIILVFTLEKS